jgi:hypothetical protein
MRIRAWAKGTCGGVGVVLVVMLGTILTAGSLGGCAGIEDALLLRDRAASARDAMDARVEESRTILKGMDDAGVPAQDPARTRAAAELAAAQAAQAAAEAAVAHLDAIIEEARRPTDGLTQGLDVLSGVLPEPLRSPALLGGALVVTLLRARQNRAALASVARSIEQVKRDDEEFRKRFKEHAATIRSIQTPAAAAAVREATGQGWMWRLPL